MDILPFVVGIANARAFVVLRRTRDEFIVSEIQFLRKKDVSPSGHQITEEGGREWENFIVTVGPTIK